MGWRIVVTYQKISYYCKNKEKKKPHYVQIHQHTWEVLTKDLDGSVSFCVSDLLVSFFQRVSLQQFQHRQTYEVILTSNVA